ncbi:unnamed protein product [Urochloa humidicola]
MAPYQASNSDHLCHFADPHHLLVRTQYSHDQTGLCSICLLKLAGVRGYGCYSCNIHVHSECAGHFMETISFFAHPSHTLKLHRSPGRVCNICRGDCPQKSFVYRCIECDFDVHPLCSLLPERVHGSASHPRRDLRMVSSSSTGSCSECHHPLPTWRYVCSFLGLQLHVTFPLTLPPVAARVPKVAMTLPAQRSVGDPAGQGWYYSHVPITTLQLSRRMVVALPARAATSAALSCKEGTVAILSSRATTTTTPMPCLLAAATVPAVVDIVVAFSAVRAA